MKVVGFSFIKNAVLYQYPIEEALRSILPLCDEIVVAVGDCRDGTRELVASIDPRIRIIDTVWDPALTSEGRVLAVETDKAYAAIPDDADWCFYIQGDEVFHESGIAAVREAMMKWKDDQQVDGLVFDYVHFYGSYDYVGSSSRWYRKEVRIIRKRKDIHSYRDAQGFRKNGHDKLAVKPAHGVIHHYGWVREPEAMQAKSRNFETYWHGEKLPEGKTFTGPFDYSQIDALEVFRGTHPSVMQARINKVNWRFEHDLSYNQLSFKDRFKNFLYKITGRRFFEYRNYKQI